MDRNILSLAVNTSFCFDGELLLFSPLTRDSPKGKESSCYATDIPKVKMGFLGQQTCAFLLCCHVMWIPSEKSLLLIILRSINVFQYLSGN